MKAMHKGLLLALLHLSIVCSLGGKLLYDRMARPRVWVKVASYDPDLPIRGRYAALRMEIPAENVREVYGETENRFAGMVRFNLEMRQGQLIAAANQNGEYWGYVQPSGSAYTIRPSEPALFFLPEHIADPSRRPNGEELWIEATIPRKGPPRPIRLGVKKDGVLTPLSIN
jgi:hypothetical protein